MQEPQEEENWDPFANAFSQGAAVEQAASAGPVSQTDNRPRLLLADSEIAFRDGTQQVLEGAGYLVETAGDGQEAIDKIKRSPPDIAVIDLKLAGKGGLEVARSLRRNPLYSSLPVIILSRSADRNEKIESLNLDVDDFMLKIGALDELLARLAMIIRRNKAILDSNALTHLPGNRTIQAKIQDMVAQGRPTAVMYFDLNNFKAYNDVYGFEGGDRVIRGLAELLAEFVQEAGGEDDFLGHIGGDDFIYVTNPDRAEKLAPLMVERFEALSPTFYNDEDKAKGYIVSTDRQGAIRQFGLVGVAIGIVHNRWIRLESFAHVAQIGAELKHAAKQSERSSYIFDRRQK